MMPLSNDVEFGIVFSPWARGRRARNCFRMARQWSYFGMRAEHMPSQVAA